MKPLVAILVLFSVVSASALTKDELIRQIRALNKQQTEELDQTKDALGLALGETDKAKGQILLVAEERNGWRDYGNDQHEKFINAEKRVAEKTATILKLTMALSALGLLIFAYLVAKFYFRLPI